MKIEVVKYDTYSDGRPNTAVIRHEKFHFEDEDDARLFMMIVKKASGFIDYYEEDDNDDTL